MVTNITYNDKPKVTFTYNDKGFRTKKVSYRDDGAEDKVTYYVRDASGSPLAIYENGIQTELPIYGASRLGIYDKASNTSVYQLTDHLGNVRAVIAKETGTADAAALIHATDYYPFGMPMPNRKIVNGQPYRYAFQGQEKDPETGKEAFQLRLWDGRIGRWLTTDPKAEFKSPYIGMGNMPMVAVDPDGGDIIILTDTDAVGGLGHTAVLIGNDTDGWRYFSKNGTKEGYFGSDGGRMYGDNYKPDLGKKIYEGATVADVIKQVNTRSNEKHNYDKYIRIATTEEQDKKAIAAARKEADSKKYNICFSSCIDVPQEALKATQIDFDYKGYQALLPNEWFINFGWFNNNRTYFSIPKPQSTLVIGEISYEFDPKND